MTKKKFPVLVTGGAGYIGSHAVLALQDAGWPVVVVDNLVTGFRSAVPSGAPFYEADVGNGEAIGKVLRAHGIGAIMHFAGSVVVPESVENPLKYYDNNTARSRVLIEAAVKEGVRHFVFSSTAAVYGEPDATRVSEDSPTRPINPYGMSKLMTEAMLRDVTNAHDLNHCILRYFNVAGADPQGRAGQSTEGATHLIKVAVEAALGKRSHVAIFGDDFATHDGTGVRDYIHVSDLVAAHVLALEALVEKPDVSMTMNCGYGRGYSVREVLDAVDRVSNKTIERRQELRRAGDPGELISENERILATLPWQPKRKDIDLIVGDALAWERRSIAQLVS
ncbi:UDP-glucose 4-epimerase GalE [Qipengyuania citrea]|uniref:UDP-glucose 4-epimerase GalE n=1 Tax=Qipengyuania citrea TaxID=225971 RepID=UPI00329854B5